MAHVTVLDGRAISSTAAKTVAGLLLGLVLAHPQRSPKVTAGDAGVTGTTVRALAHMRELPKAPKTWVGL